MSIYEWIKNQLIIIEKRTLGIDKKLYNPESIKEFDEVDSLEFIDKKKI